MKTKPGILTCSLVLWITFGTMAGFGQTTYVWTNQYQAHLGGTGDMNQATNWSPNGVPNPMTGPDANGVCGDLMQFAGLTTGPVSVTESGGTLGGFGGQSSPYGARIEVTSAQTNSVTIFSVVSLSGGLRMNWFAADAGAGGLILGDHSGNRFDIIAGELNGQTLGFTNNSTTPCVINETVSWREGGAGAHPFVFAGTGDWIVNNHLRSFNSAAIVVQKFGPGTMTWTGTNSFPESSGWYDKLGNPVRFDSGTTILKSSDLLNADTGSPNIVNNGTLLKFDWTPAPGIITTPDSIPGVISGTGPIQVNAGTVTFAGASTFTGNINLTGGELIAGSAENVGGSGPLGQGGTISFGGGTLGFGTNNAFDYSPRFNTAAGQEYSFDTGGQSVAFGTGLGSSGGSLTKLGSGALALSGASTYSGITTVGAGKLMFQGSKTGSGDITVADGAALGVTETDTPVTPNTLTLGSVSGGTLEFNNVTNTTAAPLAAGTLSSAGTVTININSGSFTAIGRSFPLFSWTSGSAPAVVLGTVSGAAGFLSTNGNNILFNVASVPLAWTGASSGNWSDPGNWTTPYSDSQPVLFDDTAAGTTGVIVDVPVHPASVTVNNSTKTYSITSSGANSIVGGTGLTKSGSGTLTLSGGRNTYTGITTAGGGIVIVSALANGLTASDIGAAGSGNTNIVLSGGGTLQYTGPGVSIDRLFSVGQNGGTIDSEGTAALVFNNSGSLGMSGSGSRTLTLTGPNAFGDTIACGIVNHPANTSLTKSGSGTWILTGTNTYAGGTSVQGGVLQIGAGGLSGTIGSGNISTASGTGIDFQRAGSLLVAGAISGGGGVSNDGTGTVILANNNTYSGGTTINAGTLQLGNGGATGSLNSTVPIVNNSLLVFNTSGSFTYSGVGVISGPGNVIVQGGGEIKVLCYSDGYTGWTRIDPNTTFQPHEGQDGSLVSSVVTNNGTLRLVSQDTFFSYAGPIVGSGRVQIGANNVNTGVITLTGTNTYTGGTFIGGNTLVLGDGVTPISGSIAGNVQFVNNIAIAQDSPRTIVFNRPDNFTFSGTITTNFSTPQANLGIVQQNGGGTVTLTGSNTYGSGTVINAGTVQVGNGGTNGSIGTGPVDDESVLIFNRSDGVTWSNAITGAGSFVKLGSGTLTLAAANSYAGSTTVSAGKLVVQGAKYSTGDIAVADSAALGVLENGVQIAANTLTLGTNSGCTLEFNNVTNTTTPPIAAGVISSSGTNTIIISSGTFTVIGQSFPLLTWTSGPVPVFRLVSINGAVGNLSISGNTLFLNITAAALTWTGNNNGSWDTATANNWRQNVSPTVFANGFPTLFDDTASGSTNVILNISVQPWSLAISNSVLTYSISSSNGNNIAGSTGLTKSGTGALVLSGGANTYTGVTTVSGGILRVGTLTNSGAASDIGAANSSPTNLVLSGGTLQYIGGGVSIDRLFTLGANGGTIDIQGPGGLQLTNAGYIGLSGSGARVLTLTGTSLVTNMLAAGLGDNGGATALVKNDPGTWVLSGTNSYSGGTLIANGTLQVGAGGASGTLGTGNVTNNGSLVFIHNYYPIIPLLVPGAISGTGSVTNNGNSTVILAGDNTYTGGTTINAGTLFIGNGGATGKLATNGSVVINNGTLSFNSSSGFTLSGIISGTTGAVWQYGPGTLTLAANNTYGGATTASGALFINGSNSASSTAVVSGGTLGGTGTLSGPVTLYSGSTLAPGASVGSVGTLTINSNLDFEGGGLAIEVNKSLAQSNDFVVVTGTLINGGAGTVTVSNLGPALAAGDKFTLFSKPMQNGGGLTVTGAGATWANNLAVDGSITVTAVTRPTLNFTLTGGNGLQFSWDTSFGNYKLQSQTNSLNVGVSTNWSDYPGGGTSPVTVPIGTTDGTVFFRLVSTP